MPARAVAPSPEDGSTAPGTNTQIAKQRGHSREGREGARHGKGGEAWGLASPLCGTALSAFASSL